MKKIIYLICFFFSIIAYKSCSSNRISYKNIRVAKTKCMSCHSSFSDQLGNASLKSMCKNNHQLTKKHLTNVFFADTTKNAHSEIKISRHQLKLISKYICNPFNH